MKKKAAVKKVTKSKSRARSKGGARIRIKKDRKLLKRLADLGLSAMAFDEPALLIFFELERRHMKPAELGLACDAAIRAMKAAVFVSDDPGEWVKAARRAADLA